MVSDAGGVLPGCGGGGPSWPLVFISERRCRVMIQNMDSGARLLELDFNSATSHVPLPVPQPPHLKNGKNNKVIKIMALTL